MAFGLRAAAANFRYDRFLGWDPNRNTFRNDWELRGRKFRIDRFTSIYHRPTRRRHFTFAAGTRIPESCVISEINSNEVWILSPVDNSEIWGKDTGQSPYDIVYAAHRAGAPSGGQARYHCAVVAGSGENLGPVLIEDTAACYVDVELRSDSRQEGVIEETTGQYFLNVSKNVTLVDGDYVSINNEWYRITEPYIDGGFVSARAIRGAPNYVDMVYHRPSGNAEGYDPVTGTVDSGTIVDLKFSGLVKRYGKLLDSTEPKFEDTYEIYIYNRHIGFTPQVGEKITVDGNKLEIASVDNHLQRLQWVLEVRR